MKNQTPAKPMHVELRLQNISLTDERKQFLKEHLGHLPEMTAHFPVCELHVDLEKYPHKGDFHVKMSLRLNNETLFTGERDDDMVVAWKSCVTQLTANLKEFKEKLARKHTYDKLPEMIEAD